MKKIFCIVLSFVLTTGGWFLASPAFAYAETQAGIVDVGNKTCPVSGDKVSGKHFVEYKGRRYGLCCPHCEKEFKKDPEKFIAENH